jgi:hypothetical protein
MSSRTESISEYRRICRDEENCPPIPAQQAGEELLDMPFLGDRDP